MSIEEIRHIAEMARNQAAGEGILDCGDGLDCAALLLVSLRRAFPAAGWRIAGGVGDPTDPRVIKDRLHAHPGGLLGDEGWTEHYWVASESHALIVDIAADGFGLPEVVVTHIDDRLYFENISHRSIEFDRAPEPILQRAIFGR